MRLEEAALRLDGRPVTAAEVLSAAVLGDFGRDLIARAGASRAAALLGRERGLETTAAELQAALDAWRRARDLIAADEFRAWMAAEGSSLRQVTAWLDREILRERLATTFRAEIDRRRPPLVELLPELHEEAVLAGLLEDLSEELAFRLVAPEPEAGEEEAVAAARVGLLGLLGCSDVAALASLLAPLGLSTERIAQLVQAELAFRRLRSKLGSGEGVERELEDYRDELVRFEVADASFRSEDVAREVLCCVREDGDTLRRSASKAGEPARARVLRGGQLDGEAFGHRLAAAAPRELFGPVAVSGRHHVAQLVRRVEPDPRSERIRDELIERLVRRSLHRAVSERVSFPSRGAA